MVGCWGCWALPLACEDRAATTSNTQAGLLFLLNGGGVVAGWRHARRLSGAVRGMARGLRAAATQGRTAAEQRAASLSGACARGAAALAAQVEGVQQMAMRRLEALKLGE